MVMMENSVKTREIQKLTTEFEQIIGILTECRRVLHEVNAYDPDFYYRTCDGLIAAIDTHLAHGQKI